MDVTSLNSVNRRASHDLRLPRAVAPFETSTGYKWAIFCLLCMHDTPSSPFYSRQPFAKCLTKFILKISISTIQIIMSIRITFYNECKNIDLTLWMLIHFSISLVEVEVHWLQTKLKCTMQTSSSIQVRAMSYLVITTRLAIRVLLPHFYFKGLDSKFSLTLTKIEAVE